MNTASLLDGGDFLSRAVSPIRELAAYEALWSKPKASFKSIADKFRQADGALPSELVPEDELDASARQLSSLFREGNDILDTPLNIIIMGVTGLI